MLHVGQHKLKCLLDSGASHSFVAANIIRELGLKTHFADALEVALTDNSVVCLHVKLWICLCTLPAMQCKKLLVA